MSSPDILKTIPVIDEAKLKPLADAVADFDKKVPWCGGTWIIPQEDLKLFYEHGESVKRILFPTRDVSELEDLAKACDPATFGKYRKDVLDETYRKAGKLDKDRFAINLNPDSCGLASMIKAELIGSRLNHRDIVVQPYKLNVYGKDSFFKTHKDTPRSENMLGSLVVVLPSDHEGGGLLLRHNGNEFVFDSGPTLAGAPAGTVAFIAFYSDVEHEVLTVRSGHRITLTYNILFAETQAPAALSVDLRTFNSAFTQLLDDPEFLPKGGYLGFGLKHQYPFGYNVIDGLCDRLKGADAAVHSASTALGLAVHARILYKVKRYSSMDALVLCRKAFDYDTLAHNLIQLLIEHCDGEIIYLSEGARISDNQGKQWQKVVFWVTQMKSMTVLESPYIAYGNEASLEFLYGDISLIIPVGRPGMRQDESVSVITLDAQKAK